MLDLPEWIVEYEAENKPKVVDPYEERLTDLPTPAQNVPLGLFLVALLVVLPLFLLVVFN